MASMFLNSLTMAGALLLALLLSPVTASAQADPRTSPAPQPRPLRQTLAYGVIRVEKDIKVKKDGKRDKNSPPLFAERNDDICVQVVGLEKWFEERRGKDGMPAEPAEEQLLLYVGGEALPGLYPQRVDEWFDDNTNKITSLRYSLERNEANKAAWKKIVRCPSFEFARPMEVSVGFDRGLRINSWVYPMPKPEQSKFYLVVIPKIRLLVGGGVILGALLIFVRLVQTTDILRDPSLHLRPYGNRPLSLARAQMAFWFFLVIGAYFFLWLISDDTDTLNASILTLIGISAGTAVGSAFIDASKQREGDLAKNVADVDLKLPHRKIVEQLAAAIKSKDAEIRQARTQLASLAATDVSALQDNENLRQTLCEEKRLLDRQKEFFGWPRWKVSVQDLLAENNILSFHRFQMCVWTLVLGIIFVHSVWSEVAMPEFSATLLGLMGLSAGTFIGFKLPEQRLGQS